MTWWYKQKRQKRKNPANLAAVERNRAYKVEIPQDGMRADRFLQLRNPWFSEAQIAACFAEERVKRNGLPCIPFKKLSRGDVVTLELEPPAEDVREMARIPYEIVHEDEWMLVVSKPPHLIVHPTGGYRYLTLLNALHLKYRSDDPARDIVPRLVNRIDKETSGRVLLGKTDKATAALAQAFEQRNVEKEYDALCEGSVGFETTLVDLPIGKPRDAEREIIRCIDHEAGQPAQTTVTRLELLGRFSLVRCLLHTGRMHQIRLHLKALGHPLVCDHHYGLRDELLASDLAAVPPAPTRIESPYGYHEGDSDAVVVERIRQVDTRKRHEYEALCRGEVVPRGEGDRLLLGRCALHSRRVRLTHPMTGREIELVAPLPADIAGAARALRAAVSRA
jgi:23S rRNA pseudouridine1911/1915/1917 synthase